MQADGCCLLVAGERRGSVLVGNRGGRCRASLRLPLPSVLVLRRAGRGAGAGVLGAWRPLLGRAGVGGG